MSLSDKYEYVNSLAIAMHTCFSKFEAFNSLTDPV